MNGADGDLGKIWQKVNVKRFDLFLPKTMAVSARALPQGIEVTFAAIEESDTVLPCRTACVAQASP
ncbi:hypothetical protein [Polaromonas sp.]|uniref:hypothetical protein n=1 Tax=Polaromonas sp. TaxID=1869339 RepID=UPI0035664C28